ncbi:MAG: NAD(P)H-hydrate epimerase [Planctomycetota bacterium]|nr:NAD(P)H-hydrate epimerase [Planctomycetota bacterium]
MTKDPTLTREAVRELDRRAIEDYGIPSILLMENAGRACAEAVRGMLAEGTADPVLVLCGPGNNGGDGLVIARTLANGGVAARVLFVGPLAKLDGASEDVRLNARLWRDLGGEIESISSADELELAHASLIVDALFGTGLTRELREPFAAIVRAINASDRPVLAVDLPSGLDADTGDVLGEAVRADVTVTFVARKRGFDLADGPGLCGRVVVAEIGIPRAFIEEAASG